MTSNIYMFIDIFYQIGTIKADHIGPCDLMHELSSLAHSIVDSNHTQSIDVCGSIYSVFVLSYV